MVKLAVQGRSVSTHRHVPGMTVEAILKEAEVAANEHSTITVDGRDAEKSTVVPREATVVVTSKIANG